MKVIWITYYELPNNGKTFPLFTTHESYVDYLMGCTAFFLLWFEINLIKFI